MITQWWIYATAKPSKRRSKVGPFENPEESLQYLRNNYYLTGVWYKISIQSREVKDASN